MGKGLTTVEGTEIFKIASKNDNVVYCHILNRTTSRFFHYKNPLSEAKHIGEDYSWRELLENTKFTSSVQWWLFVNILVAAKVETPRVSKLIKTITMGRFILECLAGFAMTINKAQVQTFDKVGVLLLFFWTQTIVCGIFKSAEQLCTIT